LFEEDQPEVRVKDEDVRIFLHQTAIDDLRLGERIRFEVDQAEEIEDVRVIGTKALRSFELAPRLGIPCLLERFTSPVVVKEKNALIERRCNHGIWHAGRDCSGW